MTEQVASGPQSCTLHHWHAPKDLTVELHHVIPVAWQLHTPVPAVSQPFPGPDSDGRGELWDDRAVWVCPTGHRNVHFWIVKLMHAAHDGQSEDPSVAYAAVKPRGRAPVELGVALEALIRFVPFGSLLTLTAAGEWGQI